MTDRPTTVTIPGDTPTAVELRIAVHGGDVDLVGRLLSDNPDLARARFVARGGSGSALHFVTDWPDYFPKGPDIVHLLVDAGADPNATTTGPGKPETPLHYAASSDDVDVAAALIDRGADLETLDGSIGTPLGQRHRIWVLARRSPLGDAGRPNRKGLARSCSRHAGCLSLYWCPASTEMRSQRASGTRAAPVNVVPQSAR